MDLFTMQFVMTGMKSVNFTFYSWASSSKNKVYN